MGAALALGGAGTAQATGDSFPPERYIYFDHASDTVSPEALQIIAEMRPDFEHPADPSAPPARYALAGSIDGAEAAAGLRPLVQQRVEAVRKAMVTAGIDPACITVTPETGVFAPFKEGQVEPLSRAVHIRPA